MDPNKKVVNILSIDGGGIRGLIPAKLIAYFEEHLVGAISDHFDIISGTSTGGILALGLSIPDENQRPKYQATELVDIYRTKGSTIFRQSWKNRFWSGFGIFGAKYPTDGINEVTSQYFGDAKLSECLSNVLITSYGIKGDHPVYFKSTKAQQMKELWDYPMRIVAQATGAAPTYFNPITITNAKGQSHVLVDGGIVRNNPAEAALAYAKEIYPNAEEYHLLSLGTGRTTTISKYTRAGLLDWASNLLEYMMDGSSQSTDYELKNVFNALKQSDFHSDSTYCRLQVEIESKYSGLDNVTSANLNQLEKYADDLILLQKDKIDALISRYNQQYREKIAVVSAHMKRKAVDAVDDINISQQSTPAMTTVA